MALGKLSAAPPNRAGKIKVMSIKIACCILNLIYRVKLWLRAKKDKPIKMIKDKKGTELNMFVIGRIVARSMTPTGGKRMYMYLPNSAPSARGRT